MTNFEDRLEKILNEQNEISFSLAHGLTAIVKPEGRPHKNWNTIVDTLHLGDPKDPEYDEEVLQALQRQFNKIYEGDERIMGITIYKDSEPVYTGKIKIIKDKMYIDETLPDEVKTALHKAHNRGII